MTRIDDAPALAPKIFRFSDVDEFRSSIRGLNYEFTPFVRRIAAEQMNLRLPGCDLNVTRVFPRAAEPTTSRSRFTVGKSPASSACPSAPCTTSSGAIAA